MWAAHKQEHVSIHSGLNGDTYEFGGMLGKLAKHGMHLYSQRFNKISSQALREIIEGFDNEINSISDDVQRDIIS